MLKHLIFLLLPLSAFSQVYKIESNDQQQLVQASDGTWSVRAIPITSPKPDTLRALMLISLSHKFHGTAHARMGYVVVQQGKEVIYLDCFKRRYKKPAKGWMYEIVNPKKD